MKKKTYTLYDENYEIIKTSNNKAKLIAEARQMLNPATVEEDRCGIIFENKAQRAISGK